MKLEEEPWCRLCGGTYNLQKAHTLGRKYDQPKPGRKELYVDPDSIVILCGPFSEHKCHPRYDAHEISILNVLTEAEQVKAVQDAGGIEAARRRLDAPAFKEHDELLARNLELEATPL